MNSTNIIIAKDIKNKTLKLSGIEDWNEMRQLIVIALVVVRVAA